MPHSTRKLLLDIILSCEEISSFIEGKGLEDFTKNRLLQLALEREFEIIGEALARLERIDQENLTEKIPEYRRIIGFRNIIATDTMSSMTQPCGISRKTEFQSF